ncbi:MAG: RDD family protein [Anaerolineae bacterium]
MRTTNVPRFAGLAPRFWALAVDLLVFCTVFFPITRLVKGVWLMTPADHRWVSGWFINDPLCLAFLAAMILYLILLEGLTGATVGKWTLGLRVINVQGGRPGLKAAALRTLLRLLDGLPAFHIVGIVSILRSPEHARLGDRLAGTRVVHIRPSPSQRALPIV